MLFDGRPGSLTAELLDVRGDRDSFDLVQLVISEVRVVVWLLRGQLRLLRNPSETTEEAA